MQIRLLLMEKVTSSKGKFQASQVALGFPGSSAGKESTCNAGDLNSIPGLGRSPGEGNSYPFQYSGLRNSMDRIVHGVTQIQSHFEETERGLWRGDKKINFI